LLAQANRIYGKINDVLGDPDSKIYIHSPEDAANVIVTMLSALEREELWVCSLNTRNRLIRMDQMYRGSLNQSQVRVGEIFRPALIYNAASIIIAHNHPSGDPTPSTDDVAITKSVVQAGKLLDIQVLDHLVVGDGRFVSLKQRGLGF
jgi:DNA repair protein RadC